MGLQPFETVVTAHHTEIYRYLLRVTWRSGDADDLSQETFLRAYRAWDGLDEAANVRAWLFTIARHKAVDAHRARRRRAIPVAEPPEPRSAAAAAAAVDGLGVDPELWVLVRALPAKQRAAVALRFVAGLSHAEVGTALECSEEAARQSLYAGLTKLRQEWTG